MPATRWTRAPDRRLRTAICCLVGSVFTSALTAPQQAEMLAAHNRWRDGVRVMPLRWSASLATRAQEWADELKRARACTLAHTNAADIGENVFRAAAIVGSDGTRQPRVLAPTDIVASWADERLDYNHATNTCAPGRTCGHYTQLVWSATQEVGCGHAECEDGAQLWVCNYSPPGNWRGQRPY